MVEKGYAPFVYPDSQVGGRKKLEIHHVDLIAQGGKVYDIDNLRILTPIEHIKLHSSEKGE